MEMLLTIVFLVLIAKLAVKSWNKDTRPEHRHNNPDHKAYIDHLNKQTGRAGTGREIPY